jgi:hypothetical protein
LTPAVTFTPQQTIAATWFRLWPIERWNRQLRELNVTTNDEGRAYIHRRLVFRPPSFV